MEAIEIVGFNNKYKKQFYDLNVEWLKSFFQVEPLDDDMLRDPEKHIINDGGYIFFAKCDNRIVGTVALMPLKIDRVFELTKMAVHPYQRGQKIGQNLLQHVIDFASAKLKLTKLILYSNTKLENAIYLYRKYGFNKVPLEPNSPYKRSNIKMELQF